MKPAAIALLALAGISCSFPDDQSADVYVTIETPAVVLVNGDEMSVRARAWQLVGGVADTGNTDDIELVNVEFQWSTADDIIAEVQNDGLGYATITALDPGLVDITARLMAFEQASNGVLPLSATPPTSCQARARTDISSPLTRTTAGVSIVT